MSRLSDVTSSELSFATGVLSVRGDVSADAVEMRVRELGYDAEVLQEDIASVPTAQSTEKPRSFWQYMLHRNDSRAAMLAFVLLLPGLIFHEFLPWLNVDSIAIDIASITAMLLAGYSVMRSAWRSLRINHDINMNVLMSIAAIGALFIGAYTEAAVVMVLFVIGETLEGYTADKARDSIRSLMSLTPGRAIRLDGREGQIVETTVEITELHVGDQVLVKPGERIPMDGVVLSGRSSVDQAPITGESRMVDKSTGDEVFAGCINGEAALRIEVTHLAADNTISRMIRLVEEAQEQRAPTQRFIDRFARYYTPAVIAIALAVALIPTLALGQPWLVPDDPTQGWLYRALALLVVACPCALVLSTPVTLVSAISNAARHGLLFKGGAFIERLNGIKAIAFDKTGTLTRGEPSVVNYLSVSCPNPMLTECAACDDVLALASAVERSATHPLAEAVVRESQRRGLTGSYPPAEGVVTLGGRGVRGVVNGRAITIGSHLYFDQHIEHAPDHCQAVGKLDSQGQTTMMISSQGDYRGFIAVADTVRDDSPAAISALKKLGIEHLLMLTGDSLSTAQVVASQVGITDIWAGCLPEEKMAVLADTRKKYGSIAMVGDGINDAPALASADVGVAIGTTAQAMETADVTIMAPSLMPLAFAIRLSRSAMRTIQVNVILSLLVKFIVFALILVGTGTMWMAVLADVGMSLLVTLNGTRLLRSPKPDTPPARKSKR
ncbi:MAG: cadmium-translocating P-type ATPase [Caldilineales bacterium]|nr:cadmium-translocating P-type ATPase [Caldilineales bacterium]